MKHSDFKAFLQYEAAKDYLSLCRKRDEKFHRKLFPYLLALAIILTSTLIYVTKL